MIPMQVRRKSGLNVIAGPCYASPMDRTLLPALAALVVILLFPAACTTTAGVQRSDEDVSAQVARLGQERRQLQAVVKAALPGISGVVANVTLDVACKAPQKLSVAVRSFFEVPQQMLVTDGETVTLYDATSGSPRFSQGNASARSLQRVLGLPLTPDDAVALLMARPPLEPTRTGYPPSRLRIGAHHDDGSVDVDVERVGRSMLRFHLDATRGVTALTVMAGDGRPLLEASYADVAADGLARTIRIVLANPPPEGPAEVVLSLSDVELNVPIDDEAFVLSPPPGTPVDAL